MSVSAVLILAAGKSRRWESKPKQLMPTWDRETVLSRMTRQVRLAGLTPTLIARDPILIHAFAGVSVDPGETNSVFESLLNTRGLWREQTVALLGDVVFTDETMAKILQMLPNLRVFLNTREVYALTWCAGDNFAMAEALREEVETVRAGGIGHFRTLPGIIPRGESILVNDKTDDIDSPEKYELVMAHWGFLV